uniref:Uncharacterized protein n=1 Tax=Anguilla anguilla TaxID=7936 RepID=A0A0E9WX28_ANGAN
MLWCNISISSVAIGIGCNPLQQAQLQYCSNLQVFSFMGEFWMHCFQTLVRKISLCPCGIFFLCGFDGYTNYVLSFQQSKTVPW